MKTPIEGYDAVPGGLTLVRCEKIGRQCREQGMTVRDMPKKLLLGVALTTLAMLSGCASRTPAPVGEASRTVVREGWPAVSVVTVPESPVVPAGSYLVKKGDTLYSIALEHGQDYREVAQWNNLADPNRIQVGQVLRVLPPDATSSPSMVTVQPIAAPAPVEVRPLTAASQPAPMVTALPTAVSANTETMKREPKAGKLPYSEQNLAQLRSEAARLPAKPLPVAAEKPTPSSSPVAATPATSPPAPVESTASPTSQAAREPDAVDWSWPLADNAGRIIAQFNDGSGGKEANKGIDIAAKPGEPVLAAGAGKVVYAGSGLRGYGQLVIVRHNATWLSAYAHNRKILVKEGQMVARGERIAEVGNTDAEQFKLHFEIRRQGKPVDPLKLLPVR